MCVCLSCPPGLCVRAFVQKGRVYLKSRFITGTKSMGVLRTTTGTKSMGVLKTTTGTKSMGVLRLTTGTKSMGVLRIATGTKSMGIENNHWPSATNWALCASI